MSWLLYTSPRSPFVRKVLIAAHEVGLADRITRQDVNTNPMAPAEELLPDNPLAMIPTLVADGEMIFDSLTILEFFHEHAGGLFPKGEARRECLTRHAMAGGMMDKSVRILDERFREANRDTEDHQAGYIASIRRGIGWMEPRLQPDRFDAGDIAFFALLSYLEFRYPDIDWHLRTGNLGAWYAAKAARPSVPPTAFQLPG